MTARAYTLSFERPATWELLRQAASAVAEALGLKSAAWEEDSRSKLPDRSYGEAAFRAVWSRPGGTLSEEAASGSGNPRDGYGYDMTWRLELTLGQRTVTARLTDSSWEPQPKSVHLLLEGIEPHELDTIRQALRELLGGDADRSDGAYGARDNVRAALEADPQRARRWLDTALAAGPPAQYGELAWRSLLELDQELSGPSPERLRRRLVETPFDPAAWEEAAQGGEFQALAERTLRRMRPVDPGALDAPSAAPVGGWRRLEDGIGPRNGEWLRLVYDLTRALWSDETVGLGNGADHVLEGSRSASSAVSARWSGEPLESPLQLRVIRTWRTYPLAWQGLGPLERYNAAPVHEVRQAWIWGPAAGDCVQFRQEARGIERRTTHLGLLVSVSGSETFRARVEAELLELTPFRWVEADSEDPFPEREERPFPGLAAEGSRREAAEQLLVEVGAGTPEFLAALRDCSCAQPKRGYCAHASLLLNGERGLRFSREHSHAARCRARAREKALGCAFSVLTRKPGDWGIEFRAREARQAWAQAEACRGEQRSGG